MEFGDIKTASKMRDLIERIAGKVVDQKRPEVRIGQVHHYDTGQQVAWILFPGETVDNLVRVRIAMNMLPTKSIAIDGDDADIVRVAGKPGAYYITDFVRGVPFNPGGGTGGAEPAITPGTTGQYWRGDKSWQTLDKTAVGLANVDNTSDLAKPLSTAAIGALAGKEPTLSTGTAAQYFRGDKVWATLDKNAVGLGNVDNTSDAAAPVSTAQLAALNLKADKASPTFTGTVTVPTPSNATDAATKAYADSRGYNGPPSPLLVKAASPDATNITLSGAQTIDGTACVAGDRVLVRDQTTATQNGIWVVQTGAWTRATDADTAAKVTRGTQVTVVSSGSWQIRYRTFTQMNDITTFATDAQQWRFFTYVDQVGAFSYPTPQGPGHLIYDANEQAMVLFDGFGWRNANGVLMCTSTSRPLYVSRAGIIAYETDTAKTIIFDGTTWQYVGGVSNTPIDTYVGVASANTDLTSATVVDITGATVSVPVGSTSEKFLVIATADMQVTAGVQTGTVRLNVGGTEQTAQIINQASTSATGRATNEQHWIVTGLTPGSVTFKLTGNNVSATGTLRIGVTHTKLTVVRLLGGAGVDVPLTTLTTSNVTAGSISYQVKGGWVYIEGNCTFASLASGSSLIVVPSTSLPTIYRPPSSLYVPGRMNVGSFLGMISRGSDGSITVVNTSGTAATSAQFQWSYPVQ